MDEKIVGTVWTFKGADLTLKTRRGESQAYVVKTEPGGLPAAFTISPVMPSKERGGTMIYERAGDRLRVAFTGGSVARPADFQPRPKQVVLVLTPKSAAVALGYATAGSGRDSCALLRKAGVHELVAGAWPDKPKAIESSMSAASCRVEGASARVDLLLIPASSRQTCSTASAPRKCATCRTGRRRAPSRTNLRSVPAHSSSSAATRRCSWR